MLLTSTSVVGDEDVTHHALNVIDTQGVVTSWNHGAQALFGPRRRSAVPQPAAPPNPARRSAVDATDVVRALVRGDLDRQ